MTNIGFKKFDLYRSLLRLNKLARSSNDEKIMCLLLADQEVIELISEKLDEKEA